MPRAIRVLATLAIGLAVFIGLPIVGWGVTDVRGFVAQPARLGYALLAIVLSTVISIRMPEVGKKWQPGAVTIRRQRLAVVLFQLISLALVVVGPFCDRRHLAVMNAPEALRYAGLVAYAVGHLVMHAAEMALGRQFSVQVTVQEGHRLITTGLYRHLRHPRYLGLALFSTGVALIFQSWLALALVGLLGLVLAWRIRDEEALLHRQFDGEWEAYVRRSRRLIPFVY